VSSRNWLGALKGQVGGACFQERGGTIDKGEAVRGQSPVGAQGRGRQGTLSRAIA
jgi:hypothetical protein